MEINYVGLPKNLSLPFFAYGIFKPGQLAYSRIERYVKDEPSVEIIDYEMLYRDGIPLICSEENKNFKTSGYLIYFSDPMNAYKIIGESETKELYMWKRVNVDGKWANALVGVNSYCGSLDNRENHISYYNYREDHFFQEALELIEDTKNEFEGKKIKDMKEFFKLQMSYMLLWSIIERFCTLSYGYSSIGKNMFNFAKENAFIDELNTITRKDVVYSSDRLEDKYLDSYSYGDSIMYYYTIRCNVVHKGKTVEDEEMNKLKYSLEELYDLFMAVYNDKLIQNDKLLEKYGEKV